MKNNMIFLNKQISRITLVVIRGGGRSSKSLDSPKLLPTYLRIQAVLWILKYFLMGLMFELFSYVFERLSLELGIMQVF